MPMDREPRFGRIYPGRYPDPLGFGKTPSRFSDPRRRVAANRFGVLYLGETVKVCFLEAVLRDRRDGAIGDLPIEEAELHGRHYAEIEIALPLKLVDLRDDGAIVMGVPTDVGKAASQTLARSVAFHEHREKPDGIIYPSRLNGHTNLAVFDRAIIKLRVVRTALCRSRHSAVYAARRTMPNGLVFSRIGRDRHMIGAA